MEASRGPVTRTRATLTPLGAAGTVTGSKYWLRVDGRNVLVDCGIFQGPDDLEQIDWQPLPFEPRDVDAVVLTHAHIDHAGYLPRLVAQGFDGPVFATAATCDLLGLLLPDSGHLQEEQAAHANKHGYARHRPARPLYTADEARESLRRLKAVAYETPTDVAAGVRVTFRPAGHLLGSASVDAEVAGSRVVFSGDLGRYSQPFMRDPAPVREADVLVLESTYGNREHAATGAEDAILAAVRATGERGVVVVPSFAVGRAQQIQYAVRRLEDAHRIPPMPVVVDSPMAIDATHLHCRHGGELNVRPDLLMHAEADCPIRCRDTRFTRTRDESKAVNAAEGPMILISANGMCTGGRIVHHLKRRLPDAANVLLMVGFQARGTRGRALADGARTVRIHGEDVPVRARVMVADALSGHADRRDLMRWAGGFERPPRLTLVTHGEPEASAALALELRGQLGWSARAAERLETVPL